jgi:hypothetical protein
VQPRISVKFKNKSIDQDHFANWNKDENYKMLLNAMNDINQKVCNKNKKIFL